MKVIGIVGWKNSGKTFFCQKIIKKLTEKGLVVSSIKRAHHDFKIDIPASDSFLHREAGSKQVIISSSKRWAKITELNNEEEMQLKELLKEIKESDIVIVEGFKNSNHPKIEVIKDFSKNYLYENLENVIATITDIKLDTKIPQFKKEEIDLIVNFILEYNDEL